MRVLLGGLVGAAASAAAWFFIEYATGQEFGWLAIAVGFITGMCINAAAGAGAAASYGRAALAVILTMMAMILGRTAYATIMQNVTNVTTIAPAAGNADDGAPVAEEGASTEGAVEVAPVERDRGSLGGPSTGLRMQRPTAGSVSELDMLWMGLAALAAYFTGKGSGRAAPVVVETAPDGTAPA
jgi:hypothetical protein